MSDEYIPMSKKDMPLKDMCKQFMIDLRISDRKLKYSEYEYEDSNLASCTIDFRDEALDKYLAKKGLTERERIYGTKGSLEITKAKQRIGEGYWAQGIIPLVLTGHPDTQLKSMKKIGDISDTKNCKITGFHVYKDTTPIVQVKLQCTEFNSPQDVISFTKGITDVSRRAARMQKIPYSNPYLAR